MFSEQVRAQIRQVGQQIEEEERQIQSLERQNGELQELGGRFRKLRDNMETRQAREKLLLNRIVHSMENVRVAGAYYKEMWELFTGREYVGIAEGMSQAMEKIQRKEQEIQNEQDQRRETIRRLWREENTLRLRLREALAAERQEG